MPIRKRVMEIAKTTTTLILVATLASTLASPLFAQQEFDGTGKRPVATNVDQQEEPQLMVGVVQHSEVQLSSTRRQPPATAQQALFRESPAVERDGSSISRAQRFQPTDPPPATSRRLTSNATAGVSSIPVQVSHDPREPNPVSLKLSDVSGAKFADPGKFLKERSLKFANPEQFLPPPRNVASKRARKTAQKGSAQFVSNRNNNLYVQDENGANQGVVRPVPSIPSRATMPRSASDQGYLEVSDVNMPIGMNPFGQVQQYDPGGIIRGNPQFSRATAPANSYAELSGQYFQDHFANWSAHNFQHKPLYFEEVNLERYGNQFKYQNLISAGQFLTNAAILPYKLGQSPPNGCQTTLGHRRPGECVPYEIHREAPSKRGLFWQGLTVSALSL